MIVLVYAPHEGGRAAAAHAAAEATWRGCPVLVVDGGRDPDDLRGQPLTAYELDELSEHLTAVDQWTQHRADRDIADAVIDLADHPQAQLVILGLMRHERFDKRMLTATSRTIVLEANCPVVTVAPAPVAIPA